MKAWLVILSLILIFAGCSITGDDDDDTVKPSFSGSKYFPMKTGSAWTYRLTETDSLGNTQTVNYTNSIIGSVSISKKAYAIILDSNKGDSLLARLDKNVLYSLRQVGDTQGNVRSEVPLINFNVQAGQSWVVYSKTYTIQGFSISQNIKGDFIGVETVQVPAGAFTDCLRYRITDTTSVTSAVSTSSNVNQEDIWLAPNAGKVKLTSAYRVNDVPVKSFSEEAISYTVPQ